MNAQIIKMDKELIDHDYLFIIIRDWIGKMKIIICKEII